MKHSIKDMWHKVKSISIIGIPYEKLIGCRKVKHLENMHKKEIQNNGKHYLHVIEKTMKDCGAIYYVFAGTLLGIVRDKRLISWDLDIDYAVVIDEFFNWDDLLEIMSKAGFKKIREFVFNGITTEQTYQVDKLTIDFFGQFYQNEIMISYSYDRLDSVEYSEENEYSVYKTKLPKVIETKQIDIDGIRVSIPINAEDVLEAIYNDDWKIPNPNWKANSGKNCSLLDGRVAYQITRW